MLLRSLLSALTVLLTTAAPAAAWQWPVRGELLERFHLSADRFAAGQHRGIDIAAAAGTPVLSACSGTVTFTGSVADSGRVVSVRCGDKSATYLHLATITARRGAGVAAGMRLGTVGTSGQPGPSQRPHLQFDVRRADDRNGYIDPLTLLGGPARRPPSEPLPAPVRLPAPERQRPRLSPRALPELIRGPVQLPRALPQLAPVPITAPAAGPLVRPGADAVRFPRRVTAPYSAPLALPAIAGGAALLLTITLALTARTLVRRSRATRGSLAASGLLRHDTDLLRQRGAAPRPRLLGDRG